MSRRFCIWLHYTLIFRQFPQKHFVYVCLFLPTQGHYQMIYHFFTPYYIPNFYKFIWFMCILQASWTVGHTSVSYTHLDVYKRQVICSLSIHTSKIHLFSFSATSTVLNSSSSKDASCLLYTSRCV